ncbi:MAG: hypothetical protein GX829_08050 [Clostridium sp.]|nr:hypothetical protein [Clostridium sp.]
MSNKLSVYLVLLLVFGMAMISIFDFSYIVQKIYYFIEMLLLIAIVYEFLYRYRLKEKRRG